MSTPLQANQLIRSTTSMFLVSWETCNTMKKPQLWATGDWQLCHNNTPAHALHLVQSFWWNIKSPRWLRPPIAQVWCSQLLDFLKTKITFEREEISDHQWDSGKYDGTADGDSNKVFLQSVLNGGRDTERTEWGPKVPTLKGTEVLLSYVQCFLYLVTSSINVSIFHSAWLNTFWTDLVKFL